MVGSYEGDEPYVYASYSRKDAEIVANILAIVKDSKARISFNPSFLPGATVAIFFLSKHTTFDSRVHKDIEIAKSLFIDSTCFYIDETYWGKEKEASYPFFKFIRLDQVSLLQIGGMLTSNFPSEVFPGPPKSVKSDN